MRPKKINIDLTQKQAHLIYWALCAGIDQYEKHLMHDDWDAVETPRSVVANTHKTHKDFCRAIKLFHTKVTRGRNET